MQSDPGKSAVQTIQLAKVAEEKRVGTFITCPDVVSLGRANSTFTLASLC